MSATGAPEQTCPDILDEDTTDSDEVFLEVSMLRAVGNARAAVIFLMVLVIFASPGVIASRQAAFLALFVGALLTIWTRFAARWRELEATNRIQGAAGFVLFGDVIWMSLFVLGTGGIASPFLALLFMPIIFGSAFFSVMKLAPALVAGLITLIIFGFGLSSEWTQATVWRTFGTIFAALAVTWVAYGVARVLERERQTNELVVRHMSEAVVLIDGTGVIRLVNPPLETLTGLQQDALIGLKVDEIGDATRYDLLRNILQDPIAGEMEGPSSIRDIEIEDDEERDLRIYSVRMGGGPRAAGWLIICQDITDLKSIARARETGVRFLSHEIRSPLNTLKITSQILAELTDQLTDSNAQRLTVILEDETDRMLRMVGQFLDLAAMDQGRFELAREDVDPAEILDRVCRTLEVRANQKNQTVETTLPESLPTIHADADRLEDVLHNVCDNALKYTPTGGHIEVSARASNGTITLCVSDNGQGIAPEIQDDIFSEFVRAAEDGKTGSKMGVGLGLYMARRIVEEHGGEISIESAVGEGADFTITLPTGHPTD